MQMRKQCTTDGNTAFEVKIYPNVDYAFIVGLIIILHEIKTCTEELIKTAVQAIQLAQEISEQE